VNRRAFLAASVGAVAASALRGVSRLYGQTSSSLTEYDGMDAMALAELVQTKQVSPEDLLEQAIARCEALNPIIKAVSQKYYDMARQAIRAGLPEGPLRGVPFLLKDMGATMKGTTAWNGSALFQAMPPARVDGALVAAYKRAGVVIFGRTNCSELGISAVTEPEIFGPTRNPWNLELTPGGSSGGSAAAVAAGIVPVAHANDGGGSLRIPASCCGLFGLKPSRGRTSWAPGPEGAGGLAVEHVVSKSVRDSALLLDLSSGKEPGDWFWPPRPEGSFAAAALRPPGQLRIAVLHSGIAGTSLDRSCVSAVRQAAELCSSLGHHVEEAAPKADFAHIKAEYLKILFSSLAIVLDSVASSRGKPIEESEVSLDVWWIYRRAQALSGKEYGAALQTLQLFSRTMARFFEKYDVLLLATMGGPPVPIGWIDTAPAEAQERQWPNTQAFNITGQPAMNVPLHRNERGVPIGVQFAGRYGEDATLLQLAGQLERAQPWITKPHAKMRRG
jgi:amidase